MLPKGKCSPREVYTDHLEELLNLNTTRFFLTKPTILEKRYICKFSDVNKIIGTLINC